LPDDDLNSVSTKWGGDCGIPMRPMFRGQAVKTPSGQWTGPFRWQWRSDASSFRHANGDQPALGLPL